ncbi:hypothetical protein GCM10022207_76190 [Streptomyces lannensis]|uniref:Uncharacterized protein n=1 Tax=Streptomyces lannensis TaxID=766498 RepID=A0ABP7LAG1_9ACTN
MIFVREAVERSPRGDIFARRRWSEPFRTIKGKSIEANSPWARSLDSGLRSHVSGRCEDGCGRVHAFTSRRPDLTEDGVHIQTDAKGTIRARDAAAAVTVP